jgi:hypothetical protein
MSTRILTPSELLQIFADEVKSRDPELSDFNEGSLLDIIGGALATAANENQELTISEFKKTFFETAHGPEITGSTDDLQRLAIDHYGDDFARPQANPATVDLTFSRANTDAGNVLIPTGTVVKTEKDANGDEILFQTIEDVLLTGLTISAQAQCEIAGTIGNVNAGAISVVDSTLTDSSVTVTNPASGAGGENAESDADYRETIRSRVKALAGATKAAIEGAILAVSGVSIVTLIERERIVIDYDTGNDSILAGAQSFRIPYPIAYIADENGQSSEALIDSVLEALEPVRACGVAVDVQGATAIALSWDGSFVLNAGGPNFATLQSDSKLITDAMADYLRNLPIGTGFNRDDANNYILGLYGPSGTNDLVSFNTNSPVSSVTIQPTEKLIPDSMTIDQKVSCS